MLENFLQMSSFISHQFRTDFLSLSAYAFESTPSGWNENNWIEHKKKTKHRTWNPAHKPKLIWPVELDESV